tara:strand:+ start:861 stop:1091 length:231 start_codon:yes stop_codon:yes gene_type:complete
MANIKFIKDTHSDPFEYEAIYEYVEGGINEKNKPGFHIAAHTEDNKHFIFEIEFDNLEEYEKFIDSLRKQVESKVK